MSEPQQDWVATLDQATRGLRDVAFLLAKYYRDLIEAGFTPEQAIQIAISYQATMLNAHNG